MKIFNTGTHGELKPQEPISREEMKRIKREIGYHDYYEEDDESTGLLTKDDASSLKPTFTGKTQEIKR
mgnify:CR=1 FL=1